MSFREALTAASRPNPLTGPFLTLPTVVAAEIVCAAAPDFVCIDMEHAALSTETVTAMMCAADSHRVPALVRVPGPEPAAIGMALDLGAAGILVPRIASAAEARAAVDAARMPPLGRRGAGPGRAAGYGRSMQRVVQDGGREAVVALQIETVGALEALDDILAVPGLDLAFVGPGDLGLGLAAAGHPMALPEAIDHILARCAASGVPAGIFASSREGLAPYRDRIALGICGSDAMALIAAFPAG